MDTLLKYLQKARKSIIILLIVIICALFIGWHQSSEIVHLKYLLLNGLVEVFVTGSGDTREIAENDAKRKAVEMVIGSSIESSTDFKDWAESRITHDRTESISKQSLEEIIKAFVKGELASTEYLKYWKNSEGLWNVEIKALVKKRPQE